jgi:hypothetical protein
MVANSSFIAILLAETVILQYHPCPSLTVSSLSITYSIFPVYHLVIPVYHL